LNGIESLSTLKEA